MIKPLRDLIVVKPIIEEKISGFLMPQVTQDKPLNGEVIACGDGLIDNNGKLKPLSVKVGDKVLYKKYANNTINIDNIEYLLMSEFEILAIL